jgi:osmotically-inducible protein OsmY
MGWLSGRALAVMIGFTAVMVAGWNALLWAQASPATQQSANTAQQIQADIQTKLQRDADLRDNHIDVRVVNDVATLKGIVDSDAERAKAVRLAAVGGVKVVDDQLKVQSTGVKEEVNDTAITSKVMAQLIATTALRHANIDPHTNNGVVTLKGSVPSEDLRRLAVDLVRNTGGVKHVDDELTVDTTTPAR